MALSKINRNSLNTGISDSSDATAVTIDSSENVGIGGTAINTSATLYNKATLHLRQPDTGSWQGSQLRMTNATTGNDASSGFDLTHSADTGTYIQNRDSGSFLFYTGGSQSLSINANGYVTMPKQPSFSAGLSGGNVTGTDATFVFNSEFFDVGGGYNNSTGVFTAPVAGKYLFQVNAITHNTNAAAYLYWSYKYNGSYVAHAYGYQHTTNKHQLYAMSILQNMAANDDMQIVNRAGAWYGGATQHGRFEGFLIG